MNERTMNELQLHPVHQRLGATFAEVNGMQLVAHYGAWIAEYKALAESAAVFDLSFRGRLCLTGSDRIKFLHGQVTNDVNRLGIGSGCYAALITGKGRMQSDMNIYRLDEELLMEFEPGLSSAVAQRLEKYIISEDVQVVDVSAPYGLLSVQGPRARTVAGQFFDGITLPEKRFQFVKTSVPEGDVYVMNRARYSSEGFDLFIPSAALESSFGKLLQAAKGNGGMACGWDAAEIARIEAGIPRYGVDMDESNIPLEAGLEEIAISFNKGCYIGQEVISRIKTYSEVQKALRLIRLHGSGPLPEKGSKLFKAGKEAGYITSATFSPRAQGNIAFAYVRKECNEIGTDLSLGADSAAQVTIVNLSDFRDFPLFQTPRHSAGADSCIARRLFLRRKAQNSPQLKKHRPKNCEVDWPSNRPGRLTLKVPPPLAKIVAPMTNGKLRMRYMR
jgi:folate-binding protein YgfZ